MSIDLIVADITSRLRQGKFPNEQAISQGIVLRLLQELGRETWDPSLVWPEYQTGEGRVDFALCHPPSRPVAFIEVKQLGKADDGVRQALEYAFHTGVQFIVLTDGKTWSFYLPAEPGSYEERRVYKLDLFEHQSREAAEILARYLSRAKVESGEVLETARKEYRSRNRLAQARAALPDAWRELVEKGDESLFELLANAVESKAGIRPEEGDIAAFLVKLNQPTSVVAQVRVPQGTVVPLTPMPNPISISEVRPAPRRSGTLTCLGKSYHYANAQEAMIIILRELAQRDPSFLQRCSQHPDVQGRTRRYIARSPGDLFPDRPDLRGLHEELPGGWVVNTNMNNALKKNVIRLASDVAGLVFGKDIIVEF